MSEVPTVNYWFDVDRKLTEFVDPKAYAIQKQVEEWIKLSVDEFIKKVAHYVRDGWKYPLNSDGEPATEHQWNYHRYGSTCSVRKTVNRIMGYLGYVWADNKKQWLFSYEWWYVWQDVLMTCRTGWGICIDTALLCTSFLRVRNRIKAYVEAGYVTFEGDPNRYGHAWTCIPDKDILIETTIHDSSKENIVSYNKAVNEGINGVVYHPIDRWNEKEYYSLGSWIQVGGFLLAPKSFNLKDVKRWWRWEIRKQKMLWELW